MESLVAIVLWCYFSDGQVICPPKLSQHVPSMFWKANTVSELEHTGDSLSPLLKQPSLYVICLVLVASLLLTVETRPFSPHRLRPGNKVSLSLTPTLFLGSIRIGMGCMNYSEDASNSASCSVF